jgi:hypothetical protein
MSAEVWMVSDIDVGVTSTDDAHNINVVGEFDQADGLGKIARSNSQAECDGNTKPEVGRSEEVVRVSAVKGVSSWVTFFL